MRQFQRILCLTVFLFCSPAVSADDDFQYWSQGVIKTSLSDKLDFHLFNDNRFKDNAEKLGLYFISPRLIYHMSKTLDLGLNYTYLQSRNVSPSAVDDSYNLQHRAEIEINPQWSAGEWMKVKMRNRVEFRWIERQGSDNTRYRQRWMFQYPLKDAGYLKSVYMNSEFFYAFHNRNINENRSVPIGLSFKLSDALGLDVFYMIQSQKGSQGDWSSNQIAGTTFSLTF